MLLAGLEVVRTRPKWSFTYDGAIERDPLPAARSPGPAAVLVAAATTANVLAGAAVLRLAGAPAFRSLDGPGAGGLRSRRDPGRRHAVRPRQRRFLRLAGAAPPARGRRGRLVCRAAAPRPLLAGPVRAQFSRPAVWWPLVLAIWAGPLIVQLASPTVPFLDVLPNHVAPVEHVRIFGSFATLTTSPSPIYGPSRLILGYVALLGQLTTITNLDAVLAEAAFALPLTILLILRPAPPGRAAVRRERGLLGPAHVPAHVHVHAHTRRAGHRRRLPARGAGSDPHRRGVTAASRRPDRRRAGRRRPARAGSRPDLILTFALGGAFLMHPLVGLVTFTAAAGALLLYPARLGRKLIPAMAGGAIMAIPQVLTMSGIGAPAWVGIVVPGDRRGPRLPAGGRRRMGRRPRGAAAGTAGSSLARRPARGRDPRPSSDRPGSHRPARRSRHRRFPGTSFESWTYACWALSFRSSGSVGAGSSWAAESPPGSAPGQPRGSSAPTASQNRPSISKSPRLVEYWIPAMLAIGAAGGLAAILRQRRLGLLRPVAIGAFLRRLLFPITSPIAIGPLVVDDSRVNAPLAANFQVSEHRGAESLGLAMFEAELGYWDQRSSSKPYTDARLIIDAPRREVVAELRAEEQAGRLGPSTKVLNIASSFQQWVAVPIGVFTGAMETSISLDPEVSIHTDGGRLLGFGDLERELAADYGYVVLQPDGLPADVLANVRTDFVASGYHPIWSNSQATIYAHR